ncbi:hypothetical protein [Pseudoruegeria sp. SK021]|uniref:GAP1-N1 domain-containing protein n=1 Tax=Pseudoruegeria sp. SK021 TaxID=1933035 RepID=UPI000A24D727|nr:hypothetical protein [Pseudoruegeria sp. SK021]OSP53505.1 hypothetical protein BV911_17630 [Pseudoruegeria sp. SK021]
MTRSASSNQQSLRIEQLLFGYDRGHTLLASSETSSKKLAASLLTDTDWDPRIETGTECYLSGRPVAGEKRYALMKTWRAPEMPRPGCVWTHVLLLDDADLSRITQLNSILAMFQKPKEVGEYREFSKHIELSLSAGSHDMQSINPETIFDLVVRTYSEADKRLVLRPSKDMEAAMLALWSQQWPALRRQFSFRLAPLTGQKLRSKSNFDIEFAPPKSKEAKDFEPVDNAIISKITNDVAEMFPTHFRRFLWRYGADAGSKKEDLVKLAQLYELLFSNESSALDTDQTLSRIVHWYPSQEAAGLLKREIMQPAAAEFSVLPDLDQFEVLQAIASMPNSNALPDPEPVEQSTVQTWITDHPTELAALLSKEASRKGPFAESLFDGITPKKNADFLWDLLENSETAFLRASGRSIEHLADSRVDTLSDEALLSLLQESRAKKPSIAKLVQFIIGRNHSGLVELVADCAPEAVTASVIDGVSASRSKALPDIGEIWTEYVKNRPEWIIHYAKNAAKRRSQLLACRYLLNADKRHVPTAVWAERLEETKDDLSSSTALEFQVFLLVQAFHEPSDGSQVLVRDSFDAVYEALSNRNLAWRTENYLTDYLPSIGWYSNWDKCLRLQIAIVALWKGLGLPKRTLQEMTRSERLKEELYALW